MSKEKRERRKINIKLWLIIKGFTKKAFKRAMVQLMKNVTEEVFKDFKRNYMTINEVDTVPDEIEKTINLTRRNAVQFVENAKAKDIVNEAKEYFVKG